MIARFAQRFQHAVHVAAAQAGIGERKLRIEFDGSLKVFDGRIDVFARDGVIDKLAQAVAPAQILFRGGRIRGAALRQFNLLVGTQFQTQAFDDVLHYRILHANDVAGVGIDAIAPKNLARPHVKQLGRHAHAFARAQKAGREDRIDTQLPAGFQWDRPAAPDI